ncbi:MAG: NAD-dependent epimerase/dehydratase family protein [Betaproteobacteria bacterium]|nr:NAD-dependent epimerase/dehydratase family protein [Betaproteobacteria bacterium]
MKILVTGAGGFVGRSLCPVLAQRGHEVLAGVRAAAAGNLPFSQIELGDLAAGVRWPAELGSVDVIVHLAGMAHRRADEETMRRINVEGTAALVKAASGRAGRIVFLSSIKVYGEESGAKPVAETDARHPEDAYGRTKLAAEGRLPEAARAGGMQYAILRPPLVYGPGVKANFLALMRVIEKGWPLPLAGIRNRRSLIYVENLADAIARCAESQAAAGRTYCVSDGAPVSTPDLCRAIGAVLGRPARLFAFPQALLELAPAFRKLTRSLEVDDSAIRNELGWRPQFTFEQGIARTAEWYLNG